MLNPTSILPDIKMAKFAGGQWQDARRARWLKTVKLVRADLPDLAGLFLDGEGQICADPDWLPREQALLLIVL